MSNSILASLKRATAFDNEAGLAIVKAVTESQLEYFQPKTEWSVYGEKRECYEHGFYAGARYQRERLQPILAALCEVVAVLQKAYPCEAHDMEPNTTMDFFRCDKCGIRPDMSDALKRIREVCK